jgi:hypothetical protein
MSKHEKNTAYRKKWRYIFADLKKIIILGKLRTK